MTGEEFTCYAARYMDMVFRLAFNYMKNHADAEDVTQNVLLKLYQYPWEFETEEHMRNWLVRVTINECTSMYRLFWRKELPLYENSDRDYGGTDGRSDRNEAFGGETFVNKPFGSEVTLSETASVLMEALMRLSAKYRVVIYLYYYEGFDTNEIADMLKVPPTTVRTRLARGRERLKKRLEED